MIDKPDWIIHYVSEHVPCEMCGKEHKDEDGQYLYYGFDGFANVHTHGLNKHNNQRDLCIVLDLGMEVCGTLLNNMGFRVANNETVFTEGIRGDVLHDEYDVKFISFDNDPTLYVILPDVNNKFPGEEGCESPYDKQEIYAKIISENKDYV